MVEAELPGVVAKDTILGTKKIKTHKFVGKPSPHPFLHKEMDYCRKCKRHFMDPVHSGFRKTK